MYDANDSALDMYQAAAAVSEAIGLQQPEHLKLCLMMRFHLPLNFA